MSALTSEVTKRTVAMHAEDFFTKPLDLPRLEKRIWNCCLTSRLRNKSGFRPNRHRNLNLFRHRYD